MPPADLEFAATEDMVLNRLAGLGCSKAGSSRTAHVFKAPNGRHFHVPRPLKGGLGYSSNQITLLSDMLESFDLELLPLDINQ